MVSILALWLPVVLSAVLVFVVSSIVHMVLKHHSKDFIKMPGEDTVLAAMRQEGVTPGDYVFPCPVDTKDMNSPEMKKKCEQGPLGFLTVMPSGSWGMGASLIQWFLYSLVIGVLVAYLTSRTVAPGAEYMAIFRVSGAAAFFAYAGAYPATSIWAKRKWSTTWKHVLDGLLYALVTAGAFAGFWPDA